MIKLSDKEIEKSNNMSFWNILGELALFRFIRRHFGNTHSKPKSTTVDDTYENNEVCSHTYQFNNSHLLQDDDDYEYFTSHYDYCDDYSHDDFIDDFHDDDW